MDRRVKEILLRIGAFFKKWLLFFLNPHLLLCFGIAWMITNGWSYLFVVFGTAFGISWMTVVGTAYLAFLWVPFTPEKIVTVIISIFLLRTFFPKDEKTLSVLREELQKIKDKMKEQKEKRAKKAAEKLQKKNTDKQA